MNEVISPNKLNEDGKSAYQRGDYLTAAQLYAAASEGYSTLGDQINSAEAANNCSVAYLQAGNPEAALKAVSNTIEVFAQLGDKRRQGTALGNLGAALEALNRLDEAEQAYQQAIALFEAIGEDELKTYTIQSLSALQFRSGRQIEALGTMQSGLEKVQRPTLKQKILKRLLKIPFNFIKK